MNKKIKKLWVEALKSGDYKQGKNCLYIKDNDGKETYCCLGVLCDLHAKATKKESFNENGTYLNQETILPPEVVKWAQFKKSTVAVMGNKASAGCDIYLPKDNSLSGLNDDGKTFKYIAKQIEKYL
jgi:hypothetical protein